MSDNKLLQNLTVKGDLGYRLKKSFSRLESKWYRPDTAFADVENWPGDWPGRTILALVMLAQATNAEPAYLDGILDNLKENLNSENYLGEILPDGELDEQQFSGHNWLLRALIEHYKWKNDEQSLYLAKQITENLYLPASGYYKNYPSDPERRLFDGDKSGSRTGRLINNWYTSTDVGCAFIPLDGLAKAYDLLRSDALYELLREMIEAFVKIDLVAVGMQTHATLSATRGIMQFYRTTGEKKYLDYAVRIFKLYLSEGATENYANFNWFGKTDTWTEPCAVIDSYILAYELFSATGDAEYLETAHRICYNAIYYAQRVNGGFGCDRCVGPESKVLGFNGDGIAEAYWCCTMRGADGLSNIAANMLSLDDNGIKITDYHNADYSDENIELSIKTEFPKNGSIKIDVHKKTDRMEYIELYIPQYAEASELKANGGEIKAQAGAMNRIRLYVDETSISLNFNISLKIKEPFGNNTGKDRFALWHGTLLLGTKPDENIISPIAENAVCKGMGVYEIDGRIYRPLDFNIDNESIDPADAEIQILFKTDIIN